MVAAAKGILGSTLQENENYQRLLASKEKRSDLALKNGLAAAELEKTPEGRAAKKEAAYKAQSDILKEDTNSLRPAAPTASGTVTTNVPNFAPNLPSSAALINNTVSTPNGPVTQTDAEKSESLQLSERLVQRRRRIMLQMRSPQVAGL